MANPLTANARLGVVEPLDSFAPLGRSILVPEESFESLLEGFGWSWHQIARGELPPGFKTIEEVQLYCIGRDAVLWSQFFMREPEDPQHKEPYNFFDYQEDSIRYEGDCVHQDASEVGKTVRSLPTASGKALRYSEAPDWSEPQCRSTSTR